MFSTWKEYRDYLMPLLIHSDDDREIFLKQFKKADKLYTHTIRADEADKCLVQCILANDVYMTKFINFTVGNKNQPIKEAKRHLRKVAATGKKV